MIERVVAVLYVKPLFPSGQCHIYKRAGVLFLCHFRLLIPSLYIHAKHNLRSSMQSVALGTFLVI